MKYDTHKGKKGFNITNINDRSIIFSTQEMACKLLCKCQKDEVSVGVIVTSSKCT